MAVALVRQLALHIKSLPQGPQSSPCSICQVMQPCSKATSRWRKEHLGGTFYLSMVGCPSQGPPHCWPIGAPFTECHGVLVEGMPFPSRRKRPFTCLALLSVLSSHRKNCIAPELWDSPDRK